MIALVRVDNRLIHGQVIEAWIPHLRATHILVADDEAAGNPLMKAAMGLAVPPGVRATVAGLDEAEFGAAQASNERVLVLVREVEDAARAHRRGLDCRSLNLGNVHYSLGRVQVSPSVFLSPAELSCLEKLAKAGAAVEARAVPRDRPLLLSEMKAKLSS